MNADREMWEKMCWNAGREWIVEDKMWKRMWEGKKKPFKVETEDRGSVTISAGKMVKDTQNRGFVLLNVKSPKTKAKEGRDFDVEIYCLVIQKADKDAVISNLVDQIKSLHPGKKLMIREPKRCIIRRLKGEGFKVAKETPLGASTLILDIPNGKKKREKKSPAPIRLEPDEILSF